MSAISYIKAVLNEISPRTNIASLSKNIKGDIVAGITVGIIALPLALAYRFQNTQKEERETSATRLEASKIVCSCGVDLTPIKQFNPFLFHTNKLSISNIIGQIFYG